MLQVEFCGLKFENPIWLSSAPPTWNGKLIKSAIEAGWGTAITKTLVLDKDLLPDVRPRLAPVRRSGKLIGLENIELVTTHGLDWWADQLKIAKSAGAPIIVSIMAAHNQQDWQELAKWAVEHGADMLELNLSCPHGTVETGRGAVIGQNPNMVQDCVKWVKESVDVPVMAKLTPNVTDIRSIAKAAEIGGADATSAINTVLGLAGIDIYTGEPQPSVFGYSTYGGNAGPHIRPIGLRCVSQIATAVRIPVSGIGGIHSWENVIEYMMVGATAVQICTAVMWNGIDIVRTWKKKIEAFMQEQGYSSFEEFRGIANEKLEEFGELKVDESLVAVIDPSKCIDCGKCYTSCKDSGANCISGPTKPTIDEERCMGCGLCAIICPTAAITMKE